jgi:spermidine/putrescine transport system substrate-binding protein
VRLKKIVAFMLISVVLLPALSACEKSREINLYTWEGYVPIDVIDAFTEETGIKVNYSYFNDNDEMYAKLKQQKNTYDVIICSDYIIDTMRKEGALIQKLDKSKLPNYKNIDPAFRHPFYDPEDEYAVPYAGAAALLVYDSRRVSVPIKSYADLWKPELKGQIWGLNSIRDMLGITLMTMGESINATDPEVLDRARRKLMELKPNMAGFGAQMPDEALIGGEASVAYLFGSQATNAATSIPDLKYVYPDEGFILYVDNIVLADGAPNKDNALKFMNFVMDERTAASITSQINYTCTNQAAKEYLPQEFLDNPMINIPSEYLAKSQGMREVGSAMTIYDEIWTEFKN